VRVNHPRPCTIFCRVFLSDEVMLIQFILQQQRRGGIRLVGSDRPVDGDGRDSAVRQLQCAKLSAWQLH
jgi:hypothetical protein